MTDQRTRIGCARARQFVEEAGQCWEDVRVIRTREEYKEYYRYGLPMAISESESGLPFGRSGSMFVDDTGKVVAYAPSCAFYT